MKEVVGDLFSLEPIDGLVADAIVIPTNTEITYTFTDARPLATMGAGVAKTARDRYPWLPRWLGERQVKYGSPKVYAHLVHDEERYVVCLPTKIDWRTGSSTGLIVKMLYELVCIADAVEWERVCVPRLGCGRGGLDWHKQVRPIMEQMLDDRFVVIALE